MNGFGLFSSPLFVSLNGLTDDDQLTFGGPFFVFVLFLPLIKYFIQYAFDTQDVEVAH